MGCGGFVILIIFRHVWTHYGVAELYRGIIPVLYRNGPSNAMFFILKEEADSRIPVVRIFSYIYIFKEQSVWHMCPALERYKFYFNIRYLFFEFIRVSKKQFLSIISVNIVTYLTLTATILLPNPVNKKFNHLKIIVSNGDI